MKGYPFVRYAFALIAGIGLYVGCPENIWLLWVALTAGVMLFASGFFRNKSNSLKSIQAAQGVGALLLLAAIGWFITYAHTPANHSDNLIHQTDTLRAYEGVVAAQPEERAKTYRVELELWRGKFVSKSWQPVSGRIIVYLDKAKLPLPQYGEVWLVSGAPRPIDPPLNPGEFNYKRYLSYRGIYHQQYLRPFQRQILGTDSPNRITRLATVVNRWADGVITRQVGSRAEYGIVNAMILGIRDDLDTELYRAYSAAGAVHVLSVSGLHVGILFAVLTFVLSFLLKRPGGKLIMLGLQLLILWFYALITGFSPPVLRSVAMFSIMSIASATGREQQLPNTLGVSAFFILCYDPYALFSAGFQLSYLAVAGISAWQSSLYQSLTFRYRWADWLWKLTAVALVAQLITFPLGVYYFHQFPTYFLLANPVVMLMSEILLPLSMLTLSLSWVPYLNDVLGWLLQKTAFVLNYAVTWTGQLPGAMWDGLWLSEVATVLTYALILAGAALLLTRNRAYVWVTSVSAAALAGLLLYGLFEQAHQRRLAVHFLPHRTAISLTDGTRSLLLTDLDSTDTRSYEFYLKNTFGQWGIAHPAVAHVSRTDNRATGHLTQTAYFPHRDYALWVWQGKTLLLVNRLSGRSHWRLPAVVDYLIIRRNALQQWEQLNGRVVACNIIFDDSNKTPITDRLLTEARQRGIVCYSVRQMGAYVAEL